MAAHAGMIDASLCSGFVPEFRMADLNITAANVTAGANAQWEKCRRSKE
jgi:hypothetical protein